MSATAARAPEGAPDLAVEVEGVRHRYGEREALCGIDLEVVRGEVLVLLGPNGGGKSTLFRILSTAMAPTEGRVRVLGADVVEDPWSVRRRLGVVFQSPGLDPKLTALENVLHHGRLFGLGGRMLADRAREVLAAQGVADRADELVETLSGGLARRVELARSLLTRPELLLLDEPSTGLDPGARRTFGREVAERAKSDGLTVVWTTHFVEEADRADRVGVVDAGRLVALGTPDELKRQVGGDVVTVAAVDPEGLRGRILDRLGVEASLVDGDLRIERERGHELVRDIVEAFPDDVRSVSFGRPTLEDVFVHLTGRALSEGEAGS